MMTTYTQLAMVIRATMLLRYSFLINIIKVSVIYYIKSQILLLVENLNSIMEFVI
jgi:hypothetical protein